jgi:hypothetical protein
VASDAVVQFARVGTSSLSGKTAAVLYNVEGGKQKATGIEGYGTLGLVVRPPPPDTTGGRDRHAEVLCLRTSDGLVPISWRDVRLNQAFPNPEPGDVVVVGYGSNFVKLGIDGRISVATTTDGTPQGQLVQVQLAGDGLVVLGPWGKITYGQEGLHLLHYSGARIDLGGIGGLPPPLDALGLGSYAIVSAAMVKVQSTAVTLGPAGGLPEPLIKSLALLTALGVTPLGTPLPAGVAPALTLAAAAMTALGAVATNLSAKPACDAAAVALLAAAAGLVAAAVPMQSNSAGAV